MVWVFYLASSLCAPNLPARSISVCWRSAGHSPWDERKFQGCCSVWLPWIPLSALRIFYKSRKDGAGALESPKFQLCSEFEPSPGHSSLAGDDLSIFLGNKAKSFTPDIGRWAGLGVLVFFPKNSLSLQCDCSCWGCTGHIIPFFLPLGFQLNCSESEKLGILPTGLKCTVCVSLFLNLLWANAVGTGQVCPFLLEFALHFWFKSSQLCPTNCPKIML